MGRIRVILSLYEDEIAILDRVALDRARVSGGKPNRSEAARVVINTFKALTRTMLAEPAGVVETSDRS